MKWKFNLLTWLYSIVLNTILTSLFLNGIWGYSTSFPTRWGSVMETTLIVFVFTLFFSVPGLLVLIFAPDLTQRVDEKQKFACTIVFCLAGAFAGYLLLCLVLNSNPFTGAIVIVAFNFIAVIAALLINRRLFYRAYINRPAKYLMIDQYGK